jgi:glutamyl-tRNA reductase
VLGEDQILHQIRRALEDRRAAGPLDRNLDRLFQVALQTGREAHQWFGGEHRSLGDVALDEIEQRRGPLVGQRVLVVGAGSMGRIAAVAAARRGVEVVVTNRSAERAESLAAAVGGSALRWGDQVPDVAGVVVALSGAWPVPDSDGRRLVERAAAVVDLSSPPAVPDELQLALQTSFVSVDDLAWGFGTALPDELRDRLEDLVSDAGRQFCRWLRARESRPAIKAMTDAVERRRRAEVDWLLRRMPDLSDDEVALVERMSGRLVGGIMHGPLSALRLDESGDLGRAARELFGV